MLFNCLEQAVFKLALSLELGRLYRFNNVCGFGFGLLGHAGFVGLNIEFVTGQLARQAHILSTLTNSNTKLVFGNEHSRALAGLVDYYPIDPRWAQGILDIGY